jgi:hypothetical protein
MMTFFPARRDQRHLVSDATETAGALPRRGRATSK